MKTCLTQYYEIYSLLEDLSLTEEVCRELCERLPGTESIDHIVIVSSHTIRSTMESIGIWESIEDVFKSLVDEEDLFRVDNSDL